MKYFLCTPLDLRPVCTEGVRWLACEEDYQVAKQYWRRHDLALPYFMWREAHESGYQYAAILKEGEIISCAAVWRFSDEAWEISAVTTWEPYRRQGYSKKVVSFLTDYILAMGRTATSSTQDDNFAMIATAKSVGFQEVAQEKVWWLK